MRFEILHDHPDYAVTKSGKVYSRKSGKWKPLKPQTDTDGYLQVRLCDSTSKRLTFVHRLVAETYIPQKVGCDEVNHIDGNKQNNNIKNLEWCTRRDNMLHAHRIGLASTQKPIIATNLNTGKQLIFSGQREAARRLDIDQGNINHALKRTNGTAYGYRFEYLSEVGDKNV